MPEPDLDRAAPKGQNAGRSEFMDSLRTGLLVGAALLVLIVPIARNHQAKQREAQVAAASAQPAPTDAPQARAAAPAIRRADFKGEDPTPQARQVADWVVFTANNGRHAFVIVDKKDARVYVFAPDGRLKDSAPALLGSARGDDTFPGVGNKPLAQVRPEEKTTPAGRFVAEPGLNSGKEDVVWVDYDAAVSMHRIRPLVARERRLERLASLTTDDNRISFGCINLPVSFYENVVSPTVRKQGAIVYVLPEVKTAQEVFGAFDVNDPEQVAAWRQLQATRVAAARDRALQKVALQRSAR
jgi:hypothetical protein